MRPHAALVTLAAALATTTGTAPAYAYASADDPDPAPRPGVFLTVSGSDHTWIRGLKLMCTPEPAGHHPHAAEACAALDAVDGDLDQLPGTDPLCTKEYDPVTVTAAGTHHGQDIAWHETYANDCLRHAATDPVFDF
ncbi:SSI family serine proteinase inhibitor [Streptomyces indicus]|uniref:Subtilisin inhibitor-like n=1 Tax=Streptomyces indicus TaxID=417292 RepID=A0A1G8ZWV2_9ACTN|nr:SSI family serine proteinase inhibitor [Streptomyces indicus]SDK19619.1 Subtilisin inhibitor-like [Streptomyces indicus]